jgi:hypothetical protein
MLAGYQSNNSLTTLATIVVSFGLHITSMMTYLAIFLLRFA